MVDLLFQQNPRFVDDEDVAALVAAVEDLGHDAEPDPSRRIQASAPTEWWVLMLRWVGDDTLHTAFGAFLAGLSKWAWKHFRARDKAPPNRIDIYGPDGRSIIASVEVEDDDNDHGSGGFVGTGPH